MQEDKKLKIQLYMPKLDDNSKFSALLDVADKKTITNAPLSFSRASHFTVNLNFNELIVLVEFVVGRSNCLFAY